MMMKRITAVFLCALMLLPAVSSASAAQIADSGYCELDLNWTLDSDGTLTLSGTWGDIWDGTGGSEPTIPVRPGSRNWDEVRSDIKKIVVLPGVDGLGDSAFAFCSNLTSAEIPDSVKAIGASLFSHCVSLTSVSLGYGITEIMPEMFAACRSLSSVEIPQGVTFIGENAFLGCTSLRTVNIPSSVTHIRRGNFRDTNLEAVCYSGTREQWKAVLIDEGNEQLKTVRIITSDSARMPGDANGDGFITAEDARMALRRAVDLEIFDVGSAQYIACDMDGDGVVTAADARLILRIAVGLDDPYNKITGIRRIALWLINNGISVNDCKEYVYTVTSGDYTYKLIYVPKDNTVTVNVIYTRTGNKTVHTLLVDGNLNAIRHQIDCYAPDGNLKASGIYFLDQFSLTDLTPERYVTELVYYGNEADRNDFQKTSAELCLMELAWLIALSNQTDIGLDPSRDLHLNELYPSTPDSCESGHKWNGGEIIRQPDCGSTGVRASTCAVCGMKKYEMIPAGGEHIWNNGEIIRQPTCGSTGVKTVTCTVCGISVTETVPATGKHTWNDGRIQKEPTCVDEGVKTYTCIHCDATKTEPISPTGEHTWDYGAITTEPTCVDEGVKTYTCIHCDITKTEPISATGKHSWNSGEITSAPTCGAAGVKTYICTVCGDRTTEAVPATGEHSWNSGEITSAPTCGDKGVKTYTCTVCGEEEYESIPATGEQSWNSGEITKDPTATETGIRTYTGTVCGSKKDETEPAVGDGGELLRTWLIQNGEEDEYGAYTFIYTGSDGKEYDFMYDENFSEHMFGKLGSTAELITKILGEDKMQMLSTVCFGFALRETDGTNCCIFADPSLSTFIVMCNDIDHYRFGIYSLDPSSFRLEDWLKNPMGLFSFDIQSVSDMAANIFEALLELNAEKNIGLNAKYHLHLNW